MLCNSSFEQDITFSNTCFCCHIRKHFIFPFPLVYKRQNLPHQGLQSKYALLPYFTFFLLQKLREIQHFKGHQNFLCTLSSQCRQQGLTGSKTFHQQNPPVLNWRCRIIQVDLYNGHKTTVVVVCQVWANWSFTKNAEMSGLVWSASDR